MYKIMMVISLIVRQFYLPNPFECFGVLAGTIINWIVEPAIHGLAYTIVGTVYTRGSFSALGSLLYLLTYGTITGVLALMSIFSFAWWWVIIVLVGVYFVCSLLTKLGGWINGETW